MIAIPTAILNLLNKVPSEAWPAVESILASAVFSRDKNDAIVKLEALAAHAALHAFADEDITRPDIPSLFPKG